MSLISNAVSRNEGRETYGLRHYLYTVSGDGKVLSMAIIKVHYTQNDHTIYFHISFKISRAAARMDHNKI